MSNLMVTASPTSRPPASRAAFQVSPKSFRLIRFVAESPIRVFPHGSFCAGLGPSTSKTTLRVTPRIVRSPPTFSSPPNSTSILPTTILKQSFVDGAQYLLLFLSQGDHTSESKAALGIAKIYPIQSI